MIKKFALLFLAQVLGICAVSAQSAEKMTEVLESPKLTYGQACYFFAASSSSIADDADYSDALSLYQDLELIDSSVKADDPAPLSAVALLASNEFVIEGSLFLKLFHNSRYAYRQMKADGIFTINDDPSLIPSGRRFFAILTDCLELYEPQEVIPDNEITSVHRF